jgi:hypothetical protein
LTENATIVVCDFCGEARFRFLVELCDMEF